MKWETKISNVTETGARIRGHNLAELVGKVSFTDMIVLMLKGKLPSKGERELLDACLVTCVDHGIQVPSITAARIVQSAGNSLNASVAAGVLAIGDHHGGAIEQAAKLFFEQVNSNPKALVEEMRERKERLPGFGHKHYDKDPRVAPLFDLAKKHKLSAKHVEFALKVDEELCTQSKKALHLNVDGAIAAILCDMGYSWKAARAFFIIPRVVGICAHTVEERESGVVYRRVEDKDVVYSGE